MIQPIMPSLFWSKYSLRLAQIHGGGEGWELDFASSCETGKVTLQKRYYLAILENTMSSSALSTWRWYMLIYGAVFSKGSDNRRKK